MEYEFSLDQKRIILLVTGLVLAAVLLFVAGLTVGLAHSSAASQAQAKPAGSLATAGNVDNQSQAAGIPQAASSSTQTGVNAEPLNAPTQQGTIASAATTDLPAAAPPAPVASSENASATHRHAHSAAAPAPAKPEPHETVANGHYSLQVGAFSRETNARELQKRLMQAGFPAEVVHRPSGGRSLYLVEAGHYGSATAATSAAHRIQQRTGITPAVRH